MIKIVKLFLILIFMLGFLNIYCTNPNENSNKKYEIIQKSTLLSDNSNLYYTLVKPKNLMNPSPLLISLHYGWDGQITRYFGKGLLDDLVIPAFEDQNILIVAPDCISDSWIDSFSINSIFELINNLRKEYNIDSTKIGLFGFSLGAIGTWFLQMKYPEKFSSSIIVEGTFEQSWVDSIKPKPIYVIHSTADELFPFLEMQKAIQKLQISNPLLVFDPVFGISHYETKSYLNAVKKTVPWLKSNWKIN